MTDITVPLERYARFAADLDEIEGMSILMAFVEREKIRAAVASGLELTEHQAAILASADDAFDDPYQWERIRRLIVCARWFEWMPPEHYAREYYAAHGGGSEG